MPDRMFDAELSVERDDAVVRLAGDLDIASVPTLESVLGGAYGRAGDVRRIVLEMAAVEFIDSSGLTALIKAHRQAVELDLRLVLRRPSERVTRTLQLTQLETVLEVER